MFETYLVNEEKCTWEFFKSEWAKYPDLPIVDKKRRKMTAKQYLKWAKPQFRLKSEVFRLTTPEYAERVNNSLTTQNIGKMFFGL